MWTRHDLQIIWILFGIYSGFLICAGLVIGAYFGGWL